MRIRFFLVAWLALCLAAEGQVKPLRKLSHAEQEARMASDLQSVAIYRQGLETTIQFALSQTNLFPAVKPARAPLPRRDEKEILWQAWKTYLDYILALDTIEHYHSQFYLLSGKRSTTSFLTGYAAFLTKYQASLRLIDAAKNNPMLDTILNEPVPELGLRAGTYAKIKFHFLSLPTATDFTARQTLYQTMKGDAPAELRQALDADTLVVAQMALWKTELLTAKNALTLLEQTGSSAWFPIQAGVAELMGQTKVYRWGKCLVSEAQLKHLQPKLLPGDVFLIRHEWYLSNIGLPGFWPHAALYIGTPEERRTFFADPAVQAWVQQQGMASGDFEELLRRSSPAAYTNSVALSKGKHPVRVMEAISAGVTFSPLERAADCDSVVVLRPLLGKTEKATALLRSFHYAGRPYDFNFDFATDSELVCSELVYKCYEPTASQRGLHLPLVEMLGRFLLPPNEIAHQFDTQYHTPDEQFEFVAFLDGYERAGKARESSVDDFRKSWQRPKWNVLVQDDIGK